MGKRDDLFRIIFLIAAIYDFVLGVVFLFFYRLAYNTFDIPLPLEPMYLHLAAAFVFAMGVGYFYIYKNLYRNIDLVKLGIVYKIAYSGVAGYFYFIGKAHVLFMMFAVFDIAFLLLFVWFLSYAKNQRGNALALNSAQDASRRKKAS